MDEGTISFKMTVPASWAGDGKESRLGPFDQGEIGVAVVKRADDMLEVRFAARKFFHTFTGPLPAPGEHDVVITWKRGGKIVLWFDGARVLEAPYSPTAH